MDELVEVVIGRVGRAHGIRGEVSIDLRTDEPGRRFFPGARVTLGSGRELTVEKTTWQRGRLLVTLAGYPDRTAVETLTGELLTTRVKASEIPSDQDEYFDRQLVGLTVLDHRGEICGTVLEVLHMPSQDLLEVKTEAGNRLVPFVKALVPVVDMDAGTLQLADVKGLLEDIE
ncbi:MAG: ribosome maturation factor RimM [Propionibacteriaceae bacterium]|nr:ribosome maturation factor RimM [Propionibacteriaceae bacterium]